MWRPPGQLVFVNRPTVGRCTGPVWVQPTDTVLSVQKMLTVRERLYGSSGSTASLPHAQDEGHPQNLMPCRGMC